MIEILLGFIIGFLAAFVGVITGSGGLVSMGYLLLAGLPFATAIATNRVASLGATASGLFTYGRAGKVDWKLGLLLAGPAFFGSLIGANLLVLVNERVAELILASFLIVLIPLIFFNKKLGIEEFEPSNIRQIVGVILYFCFGILAGMFGVGVGTISIVIIAGIFGRSLSKAAATNMVAWLLVSLAALTVFVANNLINYAVALPMMAGMFVGGYLGAKLAIKKGDRFIRILLLVIQVLVVIRLLFF